MTSALFWQSACARSRKSPRAPTAAPTRSRPCSSFDELGKRRFFWMSLTVMRPLRSPASSTTGSFSMRWRWSRRSASSSVVPTGTVTTLSLVISSLTLRSRRFSNRRSRFVRIPTSLPARVTGTPEMLKRSIKSSASRMRLSGEIVIGSTIIPDSLRLTRSTSSACRSIGMLRWTMPRPPWRAMAIASLDSVTVSIAALTIGTLIEMPRVTRVCVLTCEGRTSL